MKKLLLAVIAALTITSCGVNRYGVGEYSDSAKSEIKERFVSERKSGNKGLKQSQAQAIGGIVPVNYVDPADLARTDNYIVTTKTTIVDGLISTITGGLYSQSTVHVISLDGEVKSETSTKTVNVKTRKSIKIDGFGAAGVSYRVVEPGVFDGWDVKLNVGQYAGAGVYIPFREELYLRPSLLLERHDMSLINIGDSIDNIFEANSTSHQTWGSLEVVGGVNEGDFSVFAGAQTLGLINNRYSYVDNEYSEEWNGGTNGVHFNGVLGANYKIDDKSMFELKLTKPFDSEKTFYTVSAGIVYKF